MSFGGLQILHGKHHPFFYSEKGDSSGLAPWLQQQGAGSRHLNDLLLFPSSPFHRAGAVLWKPILLFQGCSLSLSSRDLGEAVGQDWVRRVWPKYL